MFDYEVLRVIWWGLLGVLLIGFALTDGYDMAVAALLPSVARGDTDRRLVINALAPNWEGNQVWFIVGGAAFFAAWPFVYGAAFSGFYLAMFVVLAALILRPVGFKYRSKRPDPAWRSRWDWALFVGGFVPVLVFGVAVGNVLQGVPLRLDSDLRVFYEGSFLGLFTPFTLLCGLLSVAMLVLHGATWLSFRVEHGPVHDRARRFGIAAGVATILLFALGGLFVAFGPIGFSLTNVADPVGPSNPLRSTTVAMPGGWLVNYAVHRWMLVAPIAGFAGAALALAGIARGWEKTSFAGSALAAAGIIATVGVSMFPYILPSRIDAHSSLTVWNASSSQTTLAIMLVVVVVVVFLPSAGRSRRSSPRIHGWSSCSSAVRSPRSTTRVPARSCSGGCRRARSRKLPHQDRRACCGQRLAAAQRHRRQPRPAAQPRRDGRRPRADDRDRQPPNDAVATIGRDRPSRRTHGDDSCERLGARRSRVTLGPSATP